MSESNAPLSLDDVIAFNEQLGMFARAGIEFDFPEARDSAALIKLLADVNEQTSSLVNAGATVQQALAKCPRVTERYVTALQIWKHGCDPAAALAMLNTPAKMQAELAWSLRFSLLNLLVITTLAYFGFLFIMNLHSFTLEGIYQQLRIPPSSSLATTIFFRSWMVLWGPLIPIVIIGAVLLIRRLPANRLRQWFPPSGRAIDDGSKADVAGNLANLVQHHGVDDAVGLLNPMHSFSKREPDAACDRSQPSLINWATGGHADRESRIQMLQSIECVYRQSSSARSTRLRTWIPQIITLALGGAIVLLFGLALFSPLVDALVTITQVRGVK
jgi:type II secretory pathway component PulF